MKKIIKEILDNKNWMYTLFFFDEFYKDSFYEEDMPNYSDYKNYETDDITFYLRKKYIAESSEWFYRDMEGNLFGILADFVPILDSEGQFYYFCNSFYNIPLIKAKELKRQGMYSRYRNKYIQRYNMDMTKELELYKIFCENNGIVLNENDGQDEEEFEKFIKEKIKK